MFKGKSEDGRSMVEMLGVLAIIGVLSIGGIAGYTLSMRKYRANQIADALNKYSLIVYSACQKAVIDGDITEFSSCERTKPYPSYTDSGLAQIGDLSNVVVSGFWDIGDADLTYEQIAFYPYFRDENICNAARTVTGWVSDHWCQSNAPWYRVDFKFK